MMKNITIVKLGAIGDVIQAAAAVDEYKRRNPGLKIDWVVGGPLASLLHSLRVADHIVSIDDQLILSGTWIAKGGALLRAFGHIFDQIKRCDRLYIAHTHWKYSIFALPLLFRSPALILGRIKRFYPVLTRFRVSEYFLFLSQELMTGQQGNLALQRIGENALSTSHGFRLEVDPAKKYVALVPGGSKNLMRDDFLRRWQIESYVELAGKFIARGYEVILVGSKGDAWVKPCFLGTQVKDLIGETSINDVIDIFSKVNVVVSHDTGPLHLATMTTTPLIAIFGPTPDSAVVSTNRKSLVVFKAASDIACAPCYDGVNYAPCNNPICMKSTTVDAVFQKAVALLGEEILGAQ
jgi:heptosyltransferase II